MPETDTNSSSPNNLPLFEGAFAGEILSTENFRGDLVYIVKKEKIRDMVRFLLRDHAPRFDMVVDLFAIDYLKYSTEMPERFAMVYSFLTLKPNRRVRLKTYLAETELEIDSLHDVTPMANWFEREAWDLYGIRFKGHPNLQRILCHQEFEGHPLRKDYPSDKYQRLKTAAPSTGF